MERRRAALQPLVMVLWLVLVPAALVTPAAAASAAPQVSATDYRSQILAEVNLMEQILANMTVELEAAVAPTAAPTGLPGGEEEEGLARDPLELLPHGRILSRRSAGPPQPLLPRLLTLERWEAGPAALPACQKEAVNDELVASAAELDRVAAGELTPDVRDNLAEHNGLLMGFFTDCSLRAMASGDATDLLITVGYVETHVAAARAAATPPEVGLEVGSVFMVVLITLSCLIAAGMLIGLAVLAFHYTTGTSRKPAKPAAAAGGGKGRDRKVPPGRGRPPTGQVDPAYQPTDPPGSLHQARNQRWHQSGPGGEPEPPHRPPAASKSTWGRIWGGVIRDYERSRDSVAEPPRRSSPPPRRHSPPARRHSPPPPRRSSPPPRHYSPPPQRHSPPPPQPAGDSNWAYGPSGRNKSTDSPFASAW